MTSRRQVRDAGAVDHAHWLREKRYERYQTFIDALDDSDRAFLALADNFGLNGNGPATLPPNQPDALAAADNLYEKFLAVARLQERVAMIGPQSIGPASRSVEHALHRLWKIIDETARKGGSVPLVALSTHANQFEHAINTFREEARKAIETPPNHR